MSGEAGSRAAMVMVGGGAGESYPEWSDYYLALYFALAFPLGRWLLDALVYQRLAACFIYPRKVKDRKKKLLKATESMWKLTYYTASEAFALYATAREPWFASSHGYWERWPGHTMKHELKLLYTFQGGFYVYSVAALLVWETRRKDFSVMMTHHVITIVLIAGSFITGCFRAGSLVLALHDASDVLLESAKLLKYSGSDVGASIAFALFALSWLLLRLIYFPFWIIWSTSYHCMEFLDFRNVKTVKIYYVFNTMLMSLLVLHVYWWVLICRMVLRQLQNNGTVGDDVRSDSEDD
ncbi:ASC1-like protein 3 [Selaginella moellendorffii]|uniref:ASC1-like protein 3 n=1 Tax=Selaginella moellendorffii TaxID=88036 RepID=UPI000D1C3289|nr:ASC1-like protein 3 [Selaginella moellendorffii]|eukprot:XP_002989967.2 ASC1-like protein 3 [Selaginella moellendorffii]